jgi:hypothetical protein
MLLRRPSAAQKSLSSRSSRRRGLAPKSKMLAHFSKTELEVICMRVAVAVSHAMFSARFDRGAMSAADRFIGCAGRTVVEAVAQASTNTTEKIKAYFCDRRHTGVGLPGFCSEGRPAFAARRYGGVGHLSITADAR